MIDVYVASPYVVGLATVKDLNLELKRVSFNH